MPSYTFLAIISRPKMVSSSPPPLTSNGATFGTEEKQRSESEHIADPPPYKPPKSGILSALPSWLIPYAQLMRIEKPHGYYTVLFPHFYGLLWASITLGLFDTTSPASPTTSYATKLLPKHTALLRLIRPTGWFTLGAIFLRGAACCWNDTIDAPYDRLVARCRHRPVARGAVSTFQAHAFTLLQSIIGVVILVQLPNPAMCAICATPLVALSILYPFAKRFTNYSQVLLGIALACGQLVGAATAAGLRTGSGSLMDAWGPYTLADLDKASNRRRIKGVAICFYGANVLSAVIVDTVYAQQDLQDDVKAGLKSTAVLWQKRTKSVLSLLSVANVALLTTGGIFMESHAIYYLVAVGGTALVLGLMIWEVNLRDANSCGSWFRRSILWSGLALILGLFGELMSPTASG